MAFSSRDREKLFCKGMRSRLFSYKESNITSHISHLGGCWPIRNDYISKTKLWENNQHFASSPLVSPRNDVSGTSKQIPYWWRVTTQIWMHISATCTIRETYLLCSKLWLVTDLKTVSFLTLRYACPFQDHTWLVNLLLMSYWRLGMWDIPILDTCHQLSLRVWEQFQVHLKTTGEINFIKDLRRQFIRTRSEWTQRSNTNPEGLIVTNFVTGHFEGDNGPVLYRIVYGNISGTLCHLFHKLIETFRL